jgi:NAD(P)-dependent dehydrogenase (short-subunit alcohol dehydrogenase family)
MMTFCSEAELPKNVKTFAINPGGVKTDMNPDGPNEPINKAEKIISLTKNWKDEYNGRFVHHDGSLYPL